MLEEFFKFVITWSNDRIWLQVLITILLIMFIFISLTSILLLLRKFYLKMNAENKVLEIARENTNLSKEMIIINNQQILYQKQLQKIYNRFTLDSIKIDKISKKINSEIDDPFYLYNPSHTDIESSVDPNEVTSEIFKNKSIEHILFKTSIIKDNINYLSHILSEDNFVRISVWQNDDAVVVSNVNFKDVKLTEKIRSSNFLSNNNKKELGINQSIAGRVYRTGEKQIVNNVISDPDWKKSEKSEYISILGFPLYDDKVITFDFEDKITLTEEYIVSIASLLLSNLIQNIVQSKDIYHKKLDFMTTQNELWSSQFNSHIEFEEDFDNENDFEDNFENDN